MNFLFPGAFFLSALALVIVALYLRRPRRRALEVSTLLFWRRVLEREPHRRFLGRLRNPTLSVPAAPDFSAVAAGAWRGRRRLRREAVDPRLSCSTPGRACRLPAYFATPCWPRRILSRGSGRTMKWRFSPRRGPQIVSPFSNDRKSFAGNSHRSRRRTPAETWRKLSSWRAGCWRPSPGEQRLWSSVIASCPLGRRRANAVGRPRENTAILALAQRPLPASPQSTELFVKLGNFSSTARDLEVELSLDGRPFDLQRFRIGPGEQPKFLDDCSKR